MTTPAELVALEPDATHGVVTQVSHDVGAWRFVVEIADLAVGAGVVWHDVSCYVTGFDLTRGAGEYQGRFVAAISNVELRAVDDSLAPWNADTSATFGTHVDLGAGLLIRAGWIRVVSGSVVEWIPRFTHRVESWSDETRANGNARIHRVVARDLMTELVGVPIASVALAENWYDRAVRVLTEAGWVFGYEFYGAQLDVSTNPVLELPARPEVASAIEELDATLDPAGIVWSTSPIGKIIGRPAPGDTFHAGLFAAGASGDEWVDPATTIFSYAACDDGNVEYAFGRGSQFGLDDTELNVVNHVRVSDPDDPTPYDVDAPTSISRYGRKSRQFSWLVANDEVADQIVTNRAFATLQARPLLSTIDMRRFFPEVVDLEWLDPVEIWHRTAAGRTPIDAEGRVRQIIERYKPRHPNEAISYSKETIVDVTSVVEIAELNPVQSLAATPVSSTHVNLSWTNPAQTVTPNETWVRVPQQSLLWLELDYPLTSLAWLFLDPDTEYQFDVRLARRVDGIVTHVSPVRSVTLTTDPSPAPVVDPDGGGGLVVTLPDVDDPEACVIDWVLSSSDDGETWTEVTSGTEAGNTEIALDSILFEPGLIYRVCSTEVCDGVPGTTYCSPVTVPDCTTPAQLGESPFVDAVMYVPKICEGEVLEAISGTPVSLGPAFVGIGSDGAGGYTLTSGSPGGVVAYGEATSAPLSDEDRTLHWTGGLGALEDGVILNRLGRFRIELLDAGGGSYRFAAIKEFSGGSITAIGTTAVAVDTEYDVYATWDRDTATVEIVVDGSLEDSTEDAASYVNTPNLPTFTIQLPANSWCTELAAWTSVLDVIADLDLETEILAASPLGYWKLDETSGTTATDSSGNGRHGTYSGTVTLGAVAGPDGANYPTFAGGRVTIPDANVWSLGASSGLTILILHRPTSITGASRRFLISKGAVGNYEWELTINEDFGGQLKAWMFSSAGSNRAEGRENSAGLVAGAWNMFVARYHNNSTSPGIELYSNSDTDGVTPIAWTGSPYANGTAALIIGHRGDSGASAFSGQLAHVAIFDDTVDLAPIIAAAIAGGWTP